jgi:hypothetical protein
MLVEHGVKGSATYPAHLRGAQVHFFLLLVGSSAYSSLVPPPFLPHLTSITTTTLPIEHPPTMSDSGVTSSRNPFARREEFSSQSILFYKITTTISYLLLVVTAFYYSFNDPSDDHHHRNARFWKHNGPTPFAQSAIITSIYWIVLFALQLVYAWSLYTTNTVYVTAAANIGAHFVANNLLLFGFVHLWVRSHYWLAELLIIINFFNLTFAYFRHSTTPRLIHIGTVSGPLAWNFVALYWVGARVVHTNHFAARIVSNVFIWGWAGYGVFFLAAYKDYTMGYALSILSFCKSLCTFHQEQTLQFVVGFLD